MKSHDEQLDAKLKGLGRLLRSWPSVMEDGMNEIARTTPSRQPRLFAFRPVLAGSGLGLAACLLIGAYLLLFAGGSASITLADVQGAIDSKPWVLIQYEDGAEQWANLRDRRSFRKRQDADGRNFYVGMRDHVAGIRRFYHSNWGQQIHQEAFTPKPYPQTPWEYAVGDWDDLGKELLSPTTVERNADTIDDRQVVRFDTYDMGPLGLRTLAQQVWADPETRLPLRIRKYSMPRSSSPIRVVTGEFAFPRTGPASIYDLGAPQNLPLVTNWGVIEPAAEAIIEAAKAAWHGLPDRLRVVRKSEYGLSITWRWGNRLRSESYGKTDATHNEVFPVNVPVDVEDLRQWARDNLTLYSTTVFDGRYEYAYVSGEAPRDHGKAPAGKLHVECYSTDYVDVLIPIHDQWPYVSNVGPMTVLEAEPGVPAGCVLLRYDGLGLRRDWCIDPSRDYVCLKQAEYRDIPEAGLPTGDKYWQIERTDLVQLPTGQWYAATSSRPRSEGGKVEYNVTLLGEVNDAEGFFDGEGLLQNALDEGIPVTFWAR
ncbi:MAG: hypothetical protein JW993_08590 [Sedimentisphaerales bacterium]|nr:hypothetical protein [Sedimentisphaerales bacterium]